MKQAMINYMQNIKNDELYTPEYAIKPLLKYLPKNIIEEYKPYYKGTARSWEYGIKGFWNEFKRFININ